MSKVILTEHIKGVGRMGDLVNVPNGFAFNCLVPLGKAIPATVKNVANFALQKETMIADDLKKKEIALEHAGRLPKNIFLARDVNENGILYGKITQKDLAAHLPGVTDLHAIHFEKHIHTYGVYNVKINLHHDVIVNVVISISDTEESAKKQLEKLDIKTLDNDDKAKKSKKALKNKQSNHTESGDTTQSVPRVDEKPESDENVGS